MMGKSYIWVSFMLSLSLLAGCAGDLSDGGMTFSVSADKQVVFAPGNLSEDGHGFVEHQWEYGGLFGWGTGDRPTDTTDDWHSYACFVDWGKNVEAVGARLLPTSGITFCLSGRTRKISGQWVRLTAGVVCCCFLMNGCCRWGSRLSVR